MVYPSDAYHRAVLQGMWLGSGRYIYSEERLFHRHGVAGNTDGLPGRRMGTQELPNCGMHILLSGIHQLLDLRHVHGIFPLGNFARIRTEPSVRCRLCPTL